MGTKFKFKEGDRVIYVRQCHSEPPKEEIQIGDKGVVSRCFEDTWDDSPDSVNTYRVDFGEEWEYFTEDELAFNGIVAVCISEII